MNAETLILPDNTIIDITVPPPDIPLPKPDFSEIVPESPNETPAEKSEPPALKPTFKSALQAKKRLQAFSSMRQGSLPASPQKGKAANEEKSDGTLTPVKKPPPRKGHSHDDKAKAVIKEIEEMKKEEQAYLELQRQSYRRSRSRSRSRSIDKGRFKKVEKKSRNYRRRSVSPERPRKSPKKQKKYPKNWREFYDFNSNFEVNREFDVSHSSGNNDLVRQALFESPSMPIVPFKMKTVNREDKIVPFGYIRYTRTKPLVAYSVNFAAIKEIGVSKKQLLDAAPKQLITILEKLHSNSVKFSLEEGDPKSKTSKSWYSKVWCSSGTECKLVEKSVGLSFLQTYTGDDDEILEEEITLPETEKENEPILQKKEKEPEASSKKEKEPEATTKKEKEDLQVTKDELKKEMKQEIEVKGSDEKKEEIPVEAKKEHKKKKKSKTTDDQLESVEEKEKKKKKKRKEKNKQEDSAPKKKKRKKEKAKKIAKKTKEKKHKHKKSKDEKKKEKDKDKVQIPDKPTKEQVMAELKEIEEKLAKKREEGTENKAGKEESTRKRKHSEREEDAKRTKQEKKASEEKEEHALKKKLKKMEMNSQVQPKKGEKESETKKSRHSEDVPVKPKKKSRWSEVIPKEELSFSDLKIIEEISKNESFSTKTDFDLEDLKVIEEIKANTPDTDEYHSHWESDEDVSSSAPKNTLKLNRSWESDEELFERSHNRDAKPSEMYANLEIPLNIKSFSRRSDDWEKPLSVVEELKKLEKERQSLSEERRKLELEKQKIMKLQEEVKFDRLEDSRQSTDETATKIQSPIIHKIKKEKPEFNDFSIDSLNNSLLSTVSSTESNLPVGVLENEYEEFIKAVSSDTKKKLERRNSDSSASSWSSDSDHKKKKRKSKLKKKKKKKKFRECDGLLVGKGNNIFNEFDIPVPSDLPEMVPTPVPVPSPIVPLDKILPLTAPLLLNVTIPEPPPPVEPPTPEEPKKPFVFSSIVLTSKKTPLVDNSKLKLDDDSDSGDFTDKFSKKPEEDPKTDVVKPEEIENKQTEIKESAEEPVEAVELPPPVTTDIKDKSEEVQIAPDPIEDILDVPLPPEKSPPRAPQKSPPRVPEARPPDRELKEVRIKRSHSRSPRRSSGRRRSRSGSRDCDSKRRSPIRRRGSTPPSRRRYSSPRRRSPVRRRGSPWRRSPSPRRRSDRSPRRRRRSPSFSPPRSRNGGRKRTPSPRRRSSPLNSPLDGFKKSVADSTISDDMLPQVNPDDYSDSPNAYTGKYYDRKKRSLSPQLSPKRPSLDDRISQVLGLEKNEPPPPVPKLQEGYPNYNYNVYAQQYSQFGQYVPPKPEYPQPQQQFTPVMYTQPPPPIPKPIVTPTKVLQVGNILQVVPTEEVPAMVENNVSYEGCVQQPAERSQKIVQVGNMLQIVPAVIPTSKPQIPEPQPVSQPVPPPPPEKPSAEAMMKQKSAERKAEREKRRQERERRRKDKEQKRKEREKRKQMKLKLKTENMIKRAIQIETEALANEGVEEDIPTLDPPFSVIVSTPSTCKSILLHAGSKKKKSVHFADGVRPGEGTSPSGGEELSSPPPPSKKLPKEKRYKKKTKKKKVRVKVVKRVQNIEEEDDDDEEDSYYATMAPPPPPPGSPPPHVFPARVKTHTINNVHPYVGSIIQPAAQGFPFRPPMQVVMNRHQPPPGYMPGAYPPDVSLSHPTYQGVASHH